MRRTTLRLLGISLAAVALIGYVNWAGNRDAAVFDPAAELHCGRSRIAGAQATAPPTTRETRSPAQLAEAWARARSPELVAGQHNLYEGDERVDIGFDRKAQTVAVLTFRADKQLGWHLDAVVACQAPQSTQTPGPGHLRSLILPTSPHLPTARKQKRKSAAQRPCVVFWRGASHVL